MIHEKQKKMLLGVCFFVFGVTIPLFAANVCSSRLIQFEENIATELFTLKERISEVTENQVPLVFDEEFFETEVFESGEADFLEQLARVETDYDDDLAPELWSGGKTLKTISPEILKNAFRYLNWYRFQQRNIQKQFANGLVRFDEVPEKIQTFWRLERAAQRIRLAILLSHLRIPIEMSLFSAEMYKIEPHDLLAINLSSIPKLIDVFNVHFQNQFSTLIGVKCKNNAENLMTFLNAGKRTPKGKKIFSIHGKSEKRNDHNEFPDKQAAQIHNGCDLRDFYRVIEEILPLIIKKPVMRRRFAMVYGLYGYDPHEQAVIARMEGVTAPAIRDICRRTVARIQEYLKGRGITADLFEK